jgi:hypothetical protein
MHVSNDQERQDRGQENQDQRVEEHHDREHDIREHRRLVLAGVALVGLLLLALAVQLRPLYWDTYQAGASLERFDRLRTLLMTGAWASHAGVLFPAVVLAACLRRRLTGGPAGGGVGADETLVSTGTTLLVVAGVLHAVSGAVAPVIGVPAEEFHGTPTPHALTVLADSLFWVQDNLVTVATLTLAASAATLAWAQRANRGIPGWGVRAGLLSLPLALGIPLAFYMDLRLDHTVTPWWSAAWHLSTHAATHAAIAVWVAGVITSARATRPPAPRTSAATGRASTSAPGAR